jgi:4-diphosphocytidyl-2-C-methyl-D-erythritol kinase
MPVTVRSFAKINLGLGIGALQTDGFHELRTVYQTVALHDVLRVSVGRGSGIEIRCEDPRVPRDPSNTCYRIVELAMLALKARGRVVIEIEKRLPVQGGLGGASGNAVAALLGLERALKKSLTGPERLRIAAAVGSDLPLFLVGGTVLGVGHGEEVFPAPDLPAIACVVATSVIGVSTPKAFADWDLLVASGPQGLKPGFLGGSSGTAEQLTEKLPALGALKGHGFQPRRNFQETMRGAAEAAPFQGSTRRLRGFSAGSEAVPFPGDFDDSDRPRTSQAAELCSARTAGGGRPHVSLGKLTLDGSSDRMVEFGRVLSAWLGGLSQSKHKLKSGRTSSGVPVSKGRGRAETLLLDLVRTGIENDFERVVFPKYPELREVKSVLERAGAVYASLSGSGSATYGLFPSRTAAEKAAARLRKDGVPATATTTLTRPQYWKKIFD